MTKAKAKAQAKAQDVLVGFELGTGEPVRVPFAHTVICGQTQAAGKTTTLQALLDRADRRAIAFVTKRAEGAFHGGHSIPPFFRDRADWRFVESIIEATMRERMGMQRAWIMRASEGARTLEDVQRNIREAINGTREPGKPDKWRKRPATGLSGDMYLQLDEYLKIVLPEMTRLRLAMPTRTPRLSLHPGINVMHLTEFSTEMQSLVIASVMEEAYEMDGEITVVTPEAWEFVPEGRNTPVKLAAISLIRKGLGGGKLMYFDSQDITSVDKKLLKQVAVWILGVQREINEVEHTIKQVPVAKALKPKPEDVMQLKRGQFYVCHESEVRRVYVAPVGVPQGLAARYARDGADADWKEIQAAMNRAPLTFRKDAYDIGHLLPPDHTHGGRIGRVVGVPVDEEIEVRTHVAAGEVINEAGRRQGREYGPVGHFLPPEEDTHVDYKLAYEEGQRTIARLEKRIAALEGKPTQVLPGHSIVNRDRPDASMPVPRLDANPPGRVPPPPAFESGDGQQRQVDDHMYAEIRARLLTDQGVLLAIKAIRPEIDVRVEHQVIEADQDSLRGRIAMLIHDDFFSAGRAGTAVLKELQHRGFKVAKMSVYDEMDRLAAMGFFRKQKDADRHTKFVLVEDMKVRVVEAA